MTGGFEDLDLSTETLRELTPDELAQAAGGVMYTNATGCQQLTQPGCIPSGATWFAQCDPGSLRCG